MKSLLDLIKSLYGPKAISSAIGTRTNVIRLPSSKLQKYLSTDLNIEAASDNAAKNAYNEMKELIPDIAKLNDSERLIFEGNLRRLKNKLEASGILPKQTVAKEAEVLSMETKEPVTGESLKKLTEEQGTINPPTTVAGRLEQSAKRLEGLGKNLEQEFSKSKKRSASEILDEYFHSYRTMQSIEDEGLVRAVARQIMYADLNAGRLKVPKEVEDTIRGMTAKDVLDDFSQWYGAAALEDLFDNAQKFYRMESPQEAIKFLKQNTNSNWENVYQPREKPIKEYMEPEEFKKMMENATINRVGLIVPKGSEKLDNATAKEIYDFYLKTGDRKLVQEEMKSISEGTKFDSFATEDRNKILDILTDVLKKLGPPAVAGGVGLEYLAEKTAPQTEGGTQQSLGLDYLTGMGPSEGYADGGRIGFKTGGGKKILDLINKANKELKSKSSMEKVNPKTGEVTTPKNPIMTVEDLQFKHKDAFNAHDQINIDIGDKIAPDMIAESMAEIKGKDYFSLSQKEQSNLYKKALAYVDDVRMMKRQNKSLYVKGDAITEENFGNTPFAPSQETLDNLKKAREMTKGMSLEEEMNMVLNQYDKSMFIKNEQGIVDVTNPENVQKMALLLKKDHPELYRRLEMEIGSQNNILEDFDVTGRKPNAKGGLNYLTGF
jgi:hypothetical protein